jgi:two-component system chemotaxis response regulator CheY
MANNIHCLCDCLKPFDISSSLCGVVVLPTIFQAGGNMKVIVADDSMLTRKIVIKYLEPLGYSTLQASNGGEVIGILNGGQELPDLILMDWNMPVLDGFQVLQLLRKDKRYNVIPVIMLTSESDDTNRKKALEAGAAGYITKPFTPEELINTIQETLNREKEPRS